jgi:predicted DNA-binding mobile mystery protein A
LYCRQNENALRTVTLTSLESYGTRCYSLITLIAISYGLRRLRSSQIAIYIYLDKVNIFIYLLSPKVNTLIGGRMPQLARKSFKQLKLRQLDATLKSFQPLRLGAAPRTGWLAEVRKGLGMTTAQLGRRLGLTKQRVGALERAEAEGKVTLASLKRAAHALGCELVYAIVPRESLEATVERQAQAVAASMVQHAAHSMWLERQGTSEQEILAQIKDLADKLRSERSSRLWDSASNES